MLIWLIKDGETLPIDDATRPMRTGMLAKALLNRGHTIVWWTSTFSHQRHRLRNEADREIRVSPRFTLRLLHAGAYCRNVSWQRYRHDQVFSRRFREEAERVKPPDMIVCALPINAVAEQAVDYASAQGIPSVIDIRDLWPDIWVERTPSVARPIVRALLRQKYRRTQRLLRRASSVVAVSRHYLQWGISLGQRRHSSVDAVFYIGYYARGRPASIPARVERLHERLRGQQIVVFVGSFSGSFNLGLVLEAARMFHQRGERHVHFVLAGDGDQFAKIARGSASLPNVTLTGWLNGEETCALLEISHVALAPYRLTHTVPNKLFEYMAAGLPILSSLRGEAADLLESGGIGSTYGTDDLRGFIYELSRLTSDSELRRLQGDRALVMYKTRFMAEAIYESYASHVENLACTFGPALASVRH